MKKPFLQYIFMFIVVIFTTEMMIAQQNCDTSMVVCDIMDLNGLQGVLPPDIYSEDQPSNVCLGNGVVDNPMWLSFIASVTEITITIYPKNCDISNGEMGVQAALYDDCNYGSLVDCVHDGVIDGDSIVLTSTSFVPGHVYKLLLDGRGGSICDFKIKIKEGSSDTLTPFVATMDTIYYDKNICNEISICDGATVPFTVIGQSFDTSYQMYYYWTISPPTLEHPSGIYESGFENTVDLLFALPGQYDITCFSYNDCDTTNIVNTTIKIESSKVWDEYFTMSPVCQEDFPMIVPSTEDPNGDGVFGWKGNRVITVDDDTLYYVLKPGLDSFEVVVDCGCSYMQYIDVKQIDLGKRIEVFTYFCSSDPGPYIFNGVPISGDVEQDLTLVATSGCDSLVTNKAVFLEVSGMLVIDGCTDSLKISLQDELIKPSDYDNLNYQWYNMNGGTVTDLNSDDTTLKVKSSGDYCLAITVEIDGVSCEIRVDTISVDLTNLVPSIPDLNPYSAIICDGVGEIEYSIMNPNITYTYMWFCPADATIVSGQGTDKVVIDWSNSTSGGTLSVKATNQCGEGPSSVVGISFGTIPIPDFNLMDTVCIDNFFPISYSGEIEVGYDYYWDFDGGVNTDAATGKGPYRISWDDIGVKTVSLYLYNGGCSSDTITKQVYISQKPIAPVLTCEGSGNDIIISWISDPSYYTIIINPIDGPTGSISGNSYIVTGVGIEDSVTVEIYAELIGEPTDCISTESAIIVCKPSICDPVTFQWDVSQLTFCDSDNSIYPIGLTNTSDKSGTGVMSGPGIVSGESFIPSLANLGSNSILYTYTIGDCIYKDSIKLEVELSPIVTIEEIDPVCFDDYQGQLIIHCDDEKVLSAINGGALTTDSVYDVIGDYELKVVAGYGCTSIYTGNLPLLKKPVLTIDGPIRVVVGDGVNLQSNIDITSDRIDSIVWTKNGVVFCDDCIEISSTLESLTEEYCVEVFYDMGCSIPECIILKEQISQSIYFPTIFTPDSKDENSTFLLDIGRQAAQLSYLYIYDHWGNELFTIDNESITGKTLLWDGYYRGDMVQPGVYVYAYQIKFSDGRVRSNVGNVTVIR